MLEVLAQIAFAAMALLVGVLAIYIAIRFLGKLAKFAVVLVVIVLVLWFFLSDNSFLHSLLDGVFSGWSL